MVLVGLREGCEGPELSLATLLAVEEAAALRTLAFWEVAVGVALVGMIHACLLFLFQVWRMVVSGEVADDSSVREQLSLYFRPQPLR